MTKKMWNPNQFIYVCLFVFLVSPTLQFSQTSLRRQITGLYAARKGGDTWHEYTGIPESSYKLRIRFWGRFVFQMREERVVYVKRYWFFKGRPKKWGKWRGSWKLQGDSLILNYGHRNGKRESYHIQFWDDYKVLNSWKIYRMRLTSNKLSLLKVWKGDEY